MDIGGTNMRAAIINSAGEILAQDRQPSHFSELPIDDPQVTNKTITSQICHFITKMCSKPNAPQQVGIGFPGFIRGTTGVLLSSPNMPTLNNFPLAEVISRETGLAVTIQNDGLCAAVGEYHFGVGRCIDESSLLHITLGTGIGGGLVLQGKPYSGETGMALEFGHIKIEATGLVCGCGSSGCLETRASATAVINNYQQRTGLKRQAKEIFGLARDADKNALEVLQQAGWFLGCGIAQAATLLDIGHYSIGGGLANAWLLLEPSIQNALGEKLFSAQRAQVHIHHSQCLDDAGILGAAMLALKCAI